MSWRRGKRYRTASWNRSLRVKHRRTWLAIIVSATMMLSTVLLLFALVLLARRDVSVRVDVNRNAVSETQLIGSGVNLSYAPAANLIKDASFEPRTERASRTVSAAYGSGDERGVWVPSLEDDVLTDSSYPAAAYQIFRQGEGGELTRVSQGTIGDYRSRRPLVDQMRVLWSDDTVPQQLLYDITVSRHAEGSGISSMVAVGYGGIVLWHDGEDFQPYILDALTGEVTIGINESIYYETSQLMAIEQYDGYYYVLSGNGYLFRTPVDDPLGWSRIEAIEPDQRGYSIAHPRFVTDWQHLSFVGDTLFIMSLSGECWQLRGAEAKHFFLEDVFNPIVVSYRDPGKIDFPYYLFQSDTIHLIEVMADTVFYFGYEHLYAFTFEADEDGFYGVVAAEMHAFDKNLYNDSNIMGSIWGGLSVYDEAFAVLWNFNKNYVVIKDRLLQSDSVTNEDQPRFIVEEMNSRGGLAVDAGDFISGLTPIDENRWLLIDSAGSFTIQTLSAESGDYQYPEIERYAIPDFDNMFYRSWLIPDYGFILDATVSGSGLLHVPLGTLLLLDETLDGGVQAERAVNGDLLLIEQSIPPSYNNSEISVGTWTFPDDATFGAHGEDRDTSTLQSGRNYLELDAGTELSQLIQAPSPGSTVLEAGGLYTLSLLARQEGLSDGELLVQIEGDFSPIEFRFGQIRQSWRSLTESFVVPRGRQTTDSIEVTLTWSGEGQLDLDDVFLGLTIREDNIYEPEFMSQVQAASPAIIRFEHTAIGSQGVAEESIWQYQDIVLDAGRDKTGPVTSLEAALRLSHASGALPWLVIDSYASRSSVQDLLDYLAAPLTDPQGSRRLENGTAFPWIRQFSRIFIEVTDSDQVYRTDSERAAFVDIMLDALTQSPYYNEVKNRLVLIDSMPYTAGLMRSSADLHASSLPFSLDESANFEEAVITAYDSFQDGTPRHMSRPGAIIPDLINRLVITTDSEEEPSPELTAAQILRLATYRLDEISSGVLLDFNRDEPQTESVAMRVAGILAPFLDGRRVESTVIERYENLALTETENRAGVSTEIQELHSFAVLHDGHLLVIVMNTSSRALSFEMNIRSGSGEADIVFYDEEANQQAQQRYPGDHRRILLQPGSIAVIIEEGGLG